MLLIWMAVLPLILWFVERVLPYPAIIEELAKAIFVYQAIGWRQAGGLGLVFGLSEAFLFLINANMLQSMDLILWRLLLTVPMHGITATIISIFGKKYWWLGLPLAIAGHYFFNLKIGN